MQRFDYEDYKALALEISNTYSTLDEDGDVSVIGFYNDIKELLKEFISIGYDVANIRLSEVDLDGYDKEFVLSILQDQIWVEEFWTGSDYLNDYSSVTYVFDDCNSSVLKHCHGDEVIEISTDVEEFDIDIEFECPCECNSCCDNSNLGHSVTEWTEMSPAEAKEFIKEMDERIQKFSEIFEEMKRFDRLFKW